MPLDGDNFVFVLESLDNRDLFEVNSIAYVNL